MHTYKSRKWNENFLYTPNTVFGSSNHRLHIIKKKILAHNFPFKNILFYTGYLTGQIFDEINAGKSVDIKSDCDKSTYGHSKWG